MQSPEDSALLRQYAENQSDDAFATLVARHVNLVYSVAVRCIGDRQQAEDVAQAVFLLLAKKAAQLRHEKALSSWLFQATRLTACNHLRSETRRQRREQEAHMQVMLDGRADDLWPKIAPLLDDAVSGLNETDRRAIVLRYYEGRNLRDVGAALGASEDAAEKRVSRAVEKLRSFLAKRGVTVGAVGLAATISTAVALSGATVAAGVTATAVKTIAMTTLQKTLFTTALVTAVGTGIYQAKQASALRAQVQLLQQQQATLEEALQRASTPLPSAGTNGLGRPFDGASVGSADYKQYLANLRATGTPEETIRSIIRADVNRLYADKMKALRQTAPRFEYWRGDQFIRTGAGHDAWLRMLALNDERDAALHALGVEPDLSKQQAKNALEKDWELDYLGEEHKALVLRLNRELEDKLSMREPGSMDFAQIEQAMKDRDEAIRRQLTPEEAAQYDLRQPDGTTGRARQRLGCMEATEAEFTAVFKVRQEFERQYPDLFPGMFPATNPADLTAAQRRAMREATQQVELQIQEQLRTTLGPERYADYELAQIPDYQMMYHLAMDASLGPSEARQLYQTRLNGEAQATALRNDPGLNSEERRNALNALRQATEQFLQTVLGDKSWAQFGRVPSKPWLDELEQGPGPTP